MARTRLVAAARAGRPGRSAGVSCDRFRSEGTIAFTWERTTSAGRFPVIERLEVEAARGRWSGFANGSLRVRALPLVGEAGWMQGGGRVPGFPEASGFDPEGGVLFGSIGARLAP